MYRLILSILFCLPIYCTKATPQLHLCYYLTQGCKAVIAERFTAEIRQALLRGESAELLFDCLKSNTSAITLSVYFGQGNLLCFATNDVTDDTTVELIAKTKQAIDSLSTIDYTIFTPFHEGPELPHQCSQQVLSEKISEGMSQNVDDFIINDLWKLTVLYCPKAEDSRSGRYLEKTEFYKVDIHLNDFIEDYDYLNKLSTECKGAIEYIINRIKSNQQITTEEELILKKYINDRDAYILGKPYPMNCYTISFGYRKPRVANQYIRSWNVFRLNL